MKTIGFVALFTGFIVLSLSIATARADEDRRQPPAEGEAQKPARDLPQAFITSKRVVYGYGQPIDLTFSIATPKEGTVLPDFNIVRIAPIPDGDDGEGAPSEPREVNGRHLWEAPGESFDGKKRIGALPAGQTYTETIADLREWYDMDAPGPGSYRVTFAGEWIDAQDARHALTSNTIIVRIARPPSEDEPLGEPTDGRTIPLSRIWAIDMPATMPMDRTLGGPDGLTYNAPEGPLLNDIIQVFVGESRRKVSTGFAVRGAGMDALRRAHNVIVEGEQIESSFRRGQQISIVFFTKGLVRPTHLWEIHDFGSTIVILYEFAWGDQQYITQMNRPSLALIPVTPTSVGKILVEVKPVMNLTDHNQPPPDAIQRLISQSFSFEIVP